MRKDEKKGLKQGIFVIICCIVISIACAIYIIKPRDTYEVSIKNYYLDASIEYFKANDTNKVTLDYLVKKGYADRKEEFETCDYKTSLLVKKYNTITLILNCKKFTEEYKVVINN